MHKFWLCTKSDHPVTNLGYMPKHIACPSSSTSLTCEDSVSLRIASMQKYLAFLQHWEYVLLLLFSSMDNRPVARAWALSRDINPAASRSALSFQLRAAAGENLLLPGQLLAHIILLLVILLLKGLPLIRRLLISLLLVSNSAGIYGSFCKCLCWLWSSCIRATYLTVET